MGDLPKFLRLLVAGGIVRQRAMVREVGPDTALERPLLPWLALSSVYVFWGSTYLAIRVGVETIPPFLMAGIRYLIAGGILYPLATRFGDRTGDRPGLAQWKAAAIVGALLMFGGNGMVSWAERTVPSGIAALLVGTVPLWMVLIDRVIGRAAVSRKVVAGIVLGFSGVALLVRPSASQHLPLAGTAAVLIATISWASGSLYSRTAPLPARPLVGTAMAMLTGGAVLMVAAAATGEFAHLRLDAVSSRSLLAVAWLVGPGSIVAFSAYTFVLRKLPIATVATYAYVNPVVAVLLGWVILGESLSAQTVIGGGVIVAAVALIVAKRSSSSRKTEPDVRLPRR